ncbi:hypothetical protein B0T26DRAFT_754917 [Lasiosphaeria miniovina]|uniref:Chromatin structure-remodeling complex subunit rsc9 n=1 Tax=Lasiosphaeria miniovina TaxID=1954250 RepID=A0AA40DNJ4_9PEZI|nr:uncharacterized protein B0T26DRAFT_754917 [Lasiosphaeria miniovina]KAK0709760.1 hypothetical protein B0T26DRAFT_754917 [Lasiosphaeria miniovina]
MAPPNPVPEHTIERTREYEAFIEELRSFHEERGTNFDPEPKMGTMNVDLYQLFNYIVENGGYDKVSDEKLMWRKMCEGLGLMRHNAPADAYTLKQIFYKNLAAYEIKKIHNQEPPPPEILEFTTAKGGSLLTRTLENFQAKGRGDKDESGDDGTPSRERRADETPGSGRASRGLREAPAPRVIFHPDTNSSRQTRQPSGHQPADANTPSQPQSHPHHRHPHHPHPRPQPMSQNNTPIPVHAAPHPHPNRGGASHGFNPTPLDPASALVQNYQPPPPQQLQLRIVDTPASNPDIFTRGQRMLRQPPSYTSSSTSTLIRASIPAGSLDGPNIYERCLLALRSGIRAEQAYGLNHLVKISYERGDKYKFSQFSGLAEGLTEFALGVGSLFYDVEWAISNDPELDEGAIGDLDGINGSSDILERIAQLEPKDVQDNFQPAEFTDHLTLITEAVLTIRNMVMLQENAWFMAEYPTLKDLLCILLCLPNMDIVVELKHFALDIAEQITPYLVLDSDDALYKTLLAQLSSNDRGTILTALRAIDRISMSHPTETNKLSGVPPAVLQNLMDWLLLNDDELMDSCLDFLYQYTAVVPNLEVLLRCTNVEHLVMHLTRLLSHGAKRTNKEITVSEAHIAYDVPSEDQVAPIPRDLLERLLSMEEHERCYAWLRCFFEEDPDSQITQIAIWQAYNAAFVDPLKRINRGMLNAADFIRNISTVYQTAGAQIVRDQGPNGEVQKFIIRGIKPRPHPISPEGREYFQCSWARVPGSQVKCGVLNLSVEKMWEHILMDHIGETRGEDNKFPNREGLFTCSWGICTKYRKSTKLTLVQLMVHIKTHLRAEEALHIAAQHKGSGADMHATTPSSASSAPKRPMPKLRVLKPANTIIMTYEETASVRDERNPNAPPQAAGIPLSAVLILRNIARNVVKTDSEEALLKQQRLQQGGDDSDDEGGPAAGKGIWNERLFRPVMQRLWEVFTENRLLAPYITSLFQLLERD